MSGEHGTVRYAIVKQNQYIFTMLKIDQFLKKHENNFGIFKNPAMRGSTFCKFLYKKDTVCHTTIIPRLGLPVINQPKGTFILLSGLFISITQTVICVIPWKTYHPSRLFIIFIKMSAFENTRMSLKVISLFEFKPPFSFSSLTSFFSRKLANNARTSVICYRPQTPFHHTSFLRLFLATFH